MKKAILFAIVLMLAGSACFGAVVIGKPMSVGLLGPINPLVGWSNPNWIDNGRGAKIDELGVNLGLGVSFRRFFGPVKTNQFNPYWAAGTVAIIIPYLGIGADYVWNNGFYLGGGIIWLVPEIHAGFLF